MDKKDLNSLRTGAREATQILQGERTPAREFKVRLADRRGRSAEGFALCIKSDDRGALVPSKIYRARFSQAHVGVTDENGEAAIYPADFFIQLDFPVEVETILGELQELALQ